MATTATSSRQHQPAPTPPGLSLRACRCCGLVQHVQQVPPGCRAACPRCGTTVRHDKPPRSVAWAAAFSLAALILYPAAMSLPVIEITNMGRTQAATIVSGAVELAASGAYAVAIVVLVCSVIVPIVKIGAMFILCAGDAILHRRHRAITYRALEWIGRWGMVDVLLVAILVAAVKLGDWASVHPGPGTTAFAAVVVLSLLSSAAFDPESIWENQDQTTAPEHHHTHTASTATEATAGT